MAITKEQGEKMREATREKILLAASSLFAEKGLLGTSAKDIAKKAEVSTGLMYHYYKTKEDMYNAIVDEALKEAGDIYQNWGIEKSESGIRNFVEECLVEMEKDLSFSEMVCLLEQSTDFHRQLISEYSKAISVEKAQLLVATLQGLCRLQLTLKDEFRLPTVDLMTSFLEEDTKK